MGDVETPAGSLAVTAASSNPLVVPVANIVLGGSGANRTMTITPATGQTGTTVLTLTVTDGSGLTAQDTLEFRVNPASAPTITDIVNQTISEDTATAALPFTIGDPDGVIGAVTATSSDQAIVADGSIQLVDVDGGSAIGPWTVRVTPAPNRFGSVTITVTATDHTGPALKAVDSFTVTVTPVNDAPTLTSIAGQTTTEDTPKVVTLTVGDADPSDTLTVTASSSNTGLVANPPAPGLAVSGTGTSRALTITPAANAFGTTNITVAVSDGVAAPVTRTFALTVTAVNDAPTIAAIGDRVTQEDTPAGPIAFTVDDVETAAAALTLTRTSSNTTVLPLANVVLGGSGASRTVTLTPAANRSGSSTVIITVSDGAASAPTSFTLTVTAVNDAPTLTAIGDQTTEEDTAVAGIPLTIKDVDDALAALQISATSSDASVVAVSGIVFAGTGAARTMTITPVANASGVSTITVIVRDDEAPTPASSQPTTFAFSVMPVNDPPTISDIAPQQTPEDTPIGPIPFTIGDADDDVTALQVTATSSNQSVVRDTGIPPPAGTGTSRFLTIQPEIASSGSTVITVTVSDGQATAVDTFVLDVSSVPCTYAPTTAPLSVPSAGGTVTITMDTNRASCGWTVSSDAAWAVPANAFQVYGDGAMGITLAPNPSANQRKAVLSVARQAFTVTQAGASVCTHSLSPASQTVGAPGGATAAVVTAAGNGCGQWTASSNAPWLSITGGTGSGAGTVPVAMAAAPNTDSSPRTATLTLSPGGATATVTQAGAAQCAYVVTPERLAFGPSGGSRTLTIEPTGGAGQCAWSVAPSGPAPWLTRSTSQGFGNGAVAVTAADNSTGVPREAALLVRDGAGSLVSTIAVAQDGPTSGDADGDGLPSAWEKQFGLDATSASGENGALGDPDGDGISNLEERRNCDRPIGCTHPRGFAVNTRYLAEGASNAFFETRLAVLNPGADTATVLVRFQKADGSSAYQYVALPPLTRRTILASNVDGLQEAEFSTLMESDEQVVIDRTMSWDRSGYGSHAETGLLSPRTLWYFAEGATFGGFDLFYLLQNPGDTDAEVEVRFLLPSGAPVTRRYTVGAARRFNIWVDTIPELANAEVSAVVRSTNGVPILAERAMYLSSATRPFLAGHESAAVAEPQTHWFLAEGATGDLFDLFVLIANPNDATASIEARYLLADGTIVTGFYQVPGNSRFNIWVDFEDPRLASAEVSTTIASTNGVPVIVERAMWWPGPTPATWTEAHNSAGATSTGTLWALAEGEEGGGSGAATYILVANTSALPGQARVTLVYEDGTTSQRVFPLLPNSRTNVAVGGEFPAASGKRFGAIVESLGDVPAQIVVERAMYTNGGGITWSAGTSALATNLR